MGCDVIDKIVERGIAKGREEGIDDLALLMEKLLDQNRFEDVKKLSKDKEYRMQLLQQIALV